MQSIWFKGLTKEEKESRKRLLSSNTEILKLIREVISEEFKETTPNYDSSSWAYKQADTNGANRMLQKITKLLTIEEN